MNIALRWLVIFIVTLIACVIGSMPVFVTGLVVHEVISRPLTLLVMGILAALTSSWISNLLARDSAHSRILLTVAITEAVAILLALLRIQLSPNAVVFAIWGATLSVVACLAAWKFRSTEYKLRRDIVVSFVLLALAPITVVVVIAIASLFGLTGA